MPLKPDPSFYPSPASAMEGPPEELAYVVTLNTAQNGDAQARRAHRRRPQGGLVDLRLGRRPSRHAQRRRRAAPLRLERVLDRRCARGRRIRTSSAATSSSPGCARRASTSSTSRTTRPTRSSSRSSRPTSSPGAPATAARTPSTAAPTACTSRRSATPAGDGPGGVFLLDHDYVRAARASGRSTAARRSWPTTCGGTSATTRVLTSEWGTPNMVEDGIEPELLLGGKYGHQLHVWDLRRRRHQQAIDLGPEQQMVLELRPAHDPSQALRLRRRRRLHGGPLGVGVAVAPRATGRSPPRRSSRSPPSRPRPSSCRPRCSPSAPCRRW